MISQIEERLRSFDGPLTEKLVRSPGSFGLGQVPKGLKPDATTSSVCGFCSTGCSLKIHLKDQVGINVSPDTDYPVNIGMACPKGWEALTPLAAADRATEPLFRDNRSKDFKALDWHTAADVFCQRMRAVQAEHGKESVAFLSTGQICTEEMAFLGAFTKFGMGAIHGDGNTRQCMATSVVAYKQSFGFDAPPYSYKDFEESDVICLLGSNLCVAHPIMWQRVLRNPHSPEIIVFDPRATETAMQATEHVALQPKSDLALLYGIANQLIAKDYLDSSYIEKHTSDFAGFKEFIAPFSPQAIAKFTGISEQQLDRIVTKIGTGKRVSFWWTMGVNQGHEATRTAQAIINLALMTGNIGRPGTGANSVTGQCNAMGSRLFSNTTCLFGGRDFAKAEDRELIADKLGIPVASIQEKPGKTYDQIIDAIDSGEIKALWVVANNGAHSWINQSRYREILDKLDFLVVQDMYASTETAQMADMVLPAAGWGEKEGTFINSERRIGHIKKVAQAPGSALADFSIFRLLASAWGCGEWLEKWQTPESAFQLLKSITKEQPCDFTGITDYQDVDENGGIQWPCPSTDRPEQSERRLFEDGTYYTANGKANFIWEDLTPVPGGTPYEEFPYILLTGRGSSGQWHTETRTRKSEILQKLNPKENYIEINLHDATELKLATGDKVRIESANGKCEVKCVITPNVQPGQVFMPMHFEETNQLTRGVFDPYSRQPSYKYALVKITKRR